MESKFFEIRDRMTFIPVLCVYFAGTDSYLARRAGFSRNTIIMTNLNEVKSHHEPEAWGGRTMPAAHDFIIKNWHKLNSDDVIDVEYVLGEVSKPKESERYAVIA